MVSHISTSKSCKSLGVMFDHHMSMDVQIKNVCHSALFHIRNVSGIHHLPPMSVAAQLMHSLITSRLDYCNSILYGLPDCKINWLQRVQNIAARVVSRCSKYDHITPILKSLHWLLVKMRILFKILLLAYKCLNGLAPEYMCDLLSYINKSAHLGLIL